MSFLSFSSFSNLRMRPNFPLLRALTSATLFKTCNHFRLLKVMPAAAQYPVHKQFFHGSSDFCNSGKDIVAKDDILMSNLESAEMVEDVIESIRRHLPVMNPTHQLKALQALFETHKNSSFSFSKEEIVRKSEFKTLCSAILQHSRHVELNDQITCIKCLSYFQVSSRTKIMQSFLNLISKQVNNLTLHEIIYLDFLLGFLEVCPLVEALKIAFPIVFEVKVSREIDETNLAHITECFQFASSRPVSNSCFDYLVSILTAYKGSIPVKTAVSIVRSFCDRRGSNDSHVVLLYRVLDTIVESIDELNVGESTYILNRVLTKAIHFELYLHIGLIDAAVRRAIDSDADLKHLLHVLYRITKSNYVSPPLLEHVCQKIEERPNDLIALGVAQTITVVQGLANCNYKPRNWDRIQKPIIDILNKNLSTFELPWLSICLCLVVLDCWPSAILNKVFEENFLNTFLQREYSQIDNRVLLNLYQAVSTVYPGVYTGIHPPASAIEKAAAFADPHVDLPLLPALLKGLGGAEYIHNNVFTQYHHFLDHVIVMRKGGFVVATNTTPSSDESKRTYLQDIEVPPESVIIGILVIRSRHCSINGERVRGHVALYQRSLEAMGISVVPVVLSKWNSLLEHERIPYLMQELKQKAVESEMELLQ